MQQTILLNRPRAYLTTRRICPPPLSAPRIIGAQVEPPQWKGSPRRVDSRASVHSFVVVHLSLVYIVLECEATTTKMDTYRGLLMRAHLFSDR